MMFSSDGNKILYIQSTAVVITGAWSKKYTAKKLFLTVIQEHIVLASESFAEASSSILSSERN